MNRIGNTVTSYWQVFRVVFVLFYLYLFGDALYRWDGFNYYGTFSEFAPAVALITVLWTIWAVFTALIIWITGRALEWFCAQLGLKLRTEHFLLFICIFFLSGIAAWVIKRLVWQQIPTTIQFKLMVLVCIAFLALFLTWVFRIKMVAVQERITPLVWLFGVWFMLSFPILVYHAWMKPAENSALERIARSNDGETDRPNIILVTFDTLTARDMSVYGYQRQTTPFISEWSKTSSLFTNTQADSNFTTPAVASLMTSKRSWTHQTYHIEGSKPLRNNIENLPLILKNNGYYNMAFIVNHRASVKILGISDSFEMAESPVTFHASGKRLYDIIWTTLYRLFGDKIRLYDWNLKGDFIFYGIVNAISKDYSETIFPPEKAFNRFLTVIDENPPEPFFAWIHLYPPHFPYLPPDAYKGIFNPSLELRTDKAQRGVPRSEFPLEKQPVIDAMRGRYDEFIRYCDNQFKDFIEQLEKRDKLKDTVIILSSDHGESFEHGYFMHQGPHLYEQLTHIPLVIKEPGQEEGLIVDNLAEQIDIAPTILDLVDIPVPEWMEGRSLVPLMRGKSLTSKPAFSMNFQKNRSRGHKITKGTVAVWEGDYKLIHYLEEKKSLLFNLKKDSDEVNNLFDEEPEVGQRLLSLIQNNLKRVNEEITREQEL